MQKTELSAFILRGPFFDIEKETPQYKRPNTFRYRVDIKSKKYTKRGYLFIERNGFNFV